MIAIKYEELRQSKDLSKNEMEVLLDNAIRCVDRWENFYSEARNLDPSIEDIAARHECEVDGL